LQYFIYKATVLVVKPFIGVRKGQTAPLSIQTLHFLLVRMQNIIYPGCMVGTLVAPLIAVD